MNGNPGQEEMEFAAAPFHFDSTGDCILRSSDGIHFKTIRQFLVTASPIFADMFALGRDESTDADSPPIIPLTEDSKVLHAFLTLLYPTDTPDNLNCAVMVGLVNAYDKYMVPNGRLQLYAKGLWQSAETLAEAPVQMYALAWKLKMKEEAVIASRYTHKESFETLYKGLPFEALKALIDLRDRRQEAIEGILVELGNFTDLICTLHQAELRDQVLAMRANIQDAFSAPYPVCDAMSTFFRLHYALSPMASRQRLMIRTSHCQCFANIVSTPSIRMSALIENFPCAILMPSF